MNNKLTIAGFVLVHVFAALLITTVGGCRSANPSDRNNDRIAYTGFARESIASGYTAEPAAANRAPAARPAGAVAEPVPAEVVAEPVAAEPATAEIAEKPAVAKPTSQPKATGAGHTYIVRKNDYLGSIAQREGVTSRALAEANGIKLNAMLKEGQKLTIPAATEKKVPASTTASSSAAKSAPASSGEIYVVKKGDVLSLVARKLGTSASALRAENGIKGDSIREGQKLRIPAGASKKASATQPVSTTAKAAPTAAADAAKSAPAPVAAPVAASSSGLKEIAPMGGATPVAQPVTESPAAAPAPAPVSESMEAVQVNK